MFRHNGKLLLSASDLNTFLGCQHAVALNRRILDGEEIARGGVDATMELLREKGTAHEKAYLDKLQQQGRQVREISSEGLSLEARVADTVAAMREGADVIFQGALLHGSWHGFADFLVRVEVPSALGAWSYEIVDTKLARRAKASHATQLAIYADLLEAVQGVPPARLIIRLGGDRPEAKPEEVFRPEDVVHYTRRAMARLEDFLAGPPVETAPEPCAHCSYCGFADRCKAEWQAEDHLSLVANIRRDQADCLRAAGIATLAALAGLPRGQAVEGISADNLERLRSQAFLQLETRRTGVRQHELLAQKDGRGFARLPRPDAADIFFDMEGDPLFRGGGIEYLFGMETGGQFRAFWAHDRQQEKAAFEAFIDTVMAHLAEHPQAHVYHYNHYEPSALRRLSTAHGTREAEIDHLLRRHVFVDLLVVVREGLRLGEPSYSLKNVERFFREERSGGVENAGDSIVAYEKYCAQPDPRLLEEIEAYNQVDCRATAQLHAWLLGLKPADVPWADLATAPETEIAQRQREAEAERLALRQRLQAAVGATSPKYTNLVADLCDFHRREQKPQWWALFDLGKRLERELVRDANCLGGLVAVGPNTTDKRSFVREYEFPPQETKLREKQRPTNATTLKSAGLIAALDEERCRITLRVGRAAGELPDALSLGPEPPQEDGVLREAMSRFANGVAAQQGQHAAVEGILRRDAPRITGQIPGQPLLHLGEEALAGAIRLVKALDQSHLFIQGPPGAGKTWTTSRIAVALMQAGRRVAVSSLSHKAINNLLSGIEAAAKEQGFRFRGVKKVSADQPEQAFEGDFIDNVADNGQVTDDYQLVAGTAWLFGRAEQEQRFDTLFVDEAGQVSLANLVVMGLCARNVVLVGDHQQLGQPIQGAHPDDVGVSVLEHLLQGQATVPDDRGIFLGTSYRMHPSICSWISNAFYDGRLEAHADNARQKLVLSADAPVPLAPTGLVFHGVPHVGRGQSCPEEVEEICRLWHALMGQGWVDRHGEEQVIGPEDVLVVAPYNVQVNRLRQRLPDGARVGTVDKFQGQEAAVVLVSMTTSSGDDLPRDIAFLFSPNRLNVAISRARCLAVVLANPRLLEVECHRFTDLRAVNVLCGVAEVGASN